MTTFQKTVALIATMTASEMEDFADKIADTSGDFGKILNPEQVRQTLIALGKRYKQ